MEQNDHQLRSPYQAAREKTALLNASDRFRLYMRGIDHLDFLHRMTSNSFSDLPIGSGLETVFLDNRARILDLATCYRGSDSTALILSPASRASIPSWLDRYIFAEAIELEDRTDETAMLELIGPDATHLVAQVLDEDLSSFQNHQLLCPQATEDLWLARTTWAKAPALRAFGPLESINALWQRFDAHGAASIDAATWEILRIEEGIPQLGRELTETYNPWEAGLDHAIHIDKGCYIGQEVIARLDTYDKVKQHLVGLQLTESDLPEPGQRLYDGKRELGSITSAVYSPLQGPIALAYVRREASAAGTKLDLAGIQATVVSLPFI